LQSIRKNETVWKPVLITNYYIKKKKWKVTPKYGFIIIIILYLKSVYWIGVK